MPKCRMSVGPPAGAISHLPWRRGAANRRPSSSRFSRRAVTPRSTPGSATSTRSIAVALGAGSQRTAEALDVRQLGHSARLRRAGARRLGERQGEENQNFALVG